MELPYSEKLIVKDAWERYFPALRELEYYSCQLMWRCEEVHKEFEKCRNEHINNDDVFMRLYRPEIGKDEFISSLESSGLKSKLDLT